jgi:hypothetical protein
MTDSPPKPKPESPWGRVDDVPNFFEILGAQQRRASQAANTANERGWVAYLRSELPSTDLTKLVGRFVTHYDKRNATALIEEGIPVGLIDQVGRAIANERGGPIIAAVKKPWSNALKFRDPQGILTMYLPDGTSSDDVAKSLLKFSRDNGERFEVEVKCEGVTLAVAHFKEGIFRGIEMSDEEGRSAYKKAYETKLGTLKRLTAWSIYEGGGDAEKAGRGEFFLPDKRLTESGGAENQLLDLADAAGHEISVHKISDKGVSRCRQGLAENGRRETFGNQVGRPGKIRFVCCPAQNADRNIESLRR